MNLLFTTTMTHNASNPWFIESDPSLDTVTEITEKNISIVLELFDDRRILPSVYILKGLWQIPVV